MSRSKTIEAPIETSDMMSSETPTIVPAILMAADASPSVQLTKREQELQEVEALLTSKPKRKETKAEEPELAIAMATAVVTAAPKPPMEDIPMKSLLKQVEEVAVDTMAAVVEKVAAKKAVKPKKKIKNDPASSPLARLLAQELTLNLADIGKGTGKNGKILIEDVRKFHAKLEEARRSIETSGGAYFASVGA